MWTGVNRTPAERVADHKQRQQDQGLRRISIWVPAGDAEELKAIAATMRKRAKAPLPDDGTHQRNQALVDVLDIENEPGHQDDYPSEAKRIDQEQEEAFQRMELRKLNPSGGLPGLP